MAAGPAAPGDPLPLCACALLLMTAGVLPLVSLLLPLSSPLLLAVVVAVAAVAAVVAGDGGARPDGV